MSLSNYYPQDHTHVNIRETNELQYWCERFNVTPEKLKEIVSEVGPRTGAINQFLNGFSIYQC